MTPTFWYLARCSSCLTWSIRTESKTEFDKAIKAHKTDCPLSPTGRVDA